MRDLNVLLAGTISDAHTWSLIYLEMLMQENGCHVCNLGSCVPPQEIIQVLQTKVIDLVVLSCLNGSLYQDGLAFMTEIERAGLAQKVPYVLGGKVSAPNSQKSFMEKNLQRAGFSAVFMNEDAAHRFVIFLKQLKNALRALPIAL